MASTSNSPFSRGRLMATLTTVQHTSALVFGSFLFVHLAAPAVAVVAPRAESLELAAKTMILGRVYYQNIFTEPLVVYASISVHVTSSLLKRLLRIQSSYQRKRNEKDTSSEEGYIIRDPQNEEISKKSKPFNFNFTWPTFNLQLVTGLVLLPALSIHAHLNRIAPSSSSAPINELSPSELDYSYVAYGFLTSNTAWRYITWTVYAFLLGAGAAHVVNGTDKIAKRMKAKRDMKATKRQVTSVLPGSSRDAIKKVDARRKYKRAAAINGLVSILGAAWLAFGIRRMIVEDSSSTSTWLTKRLNACYASVWPYTSFR